MEYRIDQCYDFPVDTTADVNEEFFRILQDGGREIRLLKLKYQIGRELPPVIRCRVKMLRGGEPVLSHIPAEHVFRLYGSRDWMHESYDFKVLRLPQGIGGFYELTDSNGIIFRLPSDDSRLTPGQNVRCRFERLTPGFFQLRRDREDEVLQFLTPDDIVSALNLPPVLGAFLRRYIPSLPPFAESMAECAEGRAGWVITLMEAFRSKVAELFATARVPRNVLALKAMFQAMREATLLLLEDSEFMRNATGDSRSAMQQLLTETAESVEPYQRAIRMLSDGSYESYVRSLMEKLRRSGYLYHPKLQFATMMAVFRLKPELIKKSLGSIYDAVMQWRLETWTVEPFRSAFVEQFEIYVADARRRIDELPQPETDADFGNLENVITAIALQLHIADSRSFEAYSVNRSRLYRYASLARPRSGDALLDKALYTLLNGGGKHLEFSYDSIKNYTMMVTAMSTPMHDAQRQIDTPRVLNSGHVCVELSADGLTLRRTDEAPGADQVLPNNSIPWLTPRVYLDGVPQLSRAKLNKFSAHQELWKNIELALLEERTAPEPGRRPQADEGDEVEIIITGSEPDRYSGNKNPKLFCRIADENYEDGEGYMERCDIVDFKIPAIGPEVYKDEEGRPLRFPATVVSCDENGYYHFSIKEQVNRLVRGELANRTDVVVAVITYVDGPLYGAICERGFGLFIKRTEGFENLPARTYVRVRLTDIPVEGSLVGEIVDYALEGESVEQSLALKYLLHALGESPEAEEADDEIIRDSDELLSGDELAEIIQMLRYKALAAPELLTAVDYLGLARVLAKVIGDDDTASMLQTHMALLGQHQFYADNTRIDADSLMCLEAAARSNPLLERMYKRLHIVSLLGRPDSLTELSGYVESPRNELEGTLARLVSSYNMLSDCGVEDADSLRFIKKRIASLLGVNSETHHLKHYGSESQYVEFKSSLVFPAMKKGETHVDADKERQHREILQVIAGFLNSTGGTLFLGVNDQHYEKGLQGDFPYLPKNVRTIDNLCVYLDNLVRAGYDQGATVGNYVHISPDEESERGVVVVKVDPSRRPVTLGGDIFVRQSSSTVPMLDADRQIFIADRERRYDEMMRISGVTMPDDGTAEEAVESDGAASAPSVHASASDDKTEPAESRLIPTSAWRHNVLHSYEDGYYDPFCYIYFNDKGEVSYSRSDIYRDQDGDCLGALAVSPDETSGFLLLCFEGEYVAKVPLRELFEKPENTAVRYWDGAPLCFVTVARQGDGLMCVFADNGGGMSARCTPVTEISDCRITAQPQRIIDMPVAGMVGCELVASSAFEQLDKYMSKRLSQRQTGFTLHVRPGQDAAAKAVESLFAQCRPQSK